MDIRRALTVPLLALGLGICTFVAWPLGGGPTALASVGGPSVTQLWPQRAPAAQNLSAIAWRPDFESAMAESRATGRPVMVDFYTTWCEWCKKLDTDVYTDRGVINESANFIAVKVDAEKRADIASQYHVQGYPDIVWIGANGHIIDRIDGYAEGPQFIQMMRSVSSQSPQPNLYYSPQPHLLQRSSHRRHRARHSAPKHRAAKRHHTRVVPKKHHHPAHR